MKYPDLICAMDCYLYANHNRQASAIVLLFLMVQLGLMLDFSMVSVVEALSTRHLESLMMLCQLKWLGIEMLQPTTSELYVEVTIAKLTALSRQSCCSWYGNLGSRK